jgi:hypothetical protein
LTVEDDEVTARLFEDTGDATPLDELSFVDPDPLEEGYSGVICLDFDSLGIDAYYDTLVSEAIPEPLVLTLLVAGLMVGLLPVRRSRNR